MSLTQECTRVNALGCVSGSMLQKGSSEAKESPSKGMSLGGFSSSMKDSQISTTVMDY